MILSGVTHVTITQPGWLTASTYGCTAGLLLKVHRSPLLDLDSQMFSPVRDILEGHIPKVIDEQTITDPSMMFGKAIRTIYLLGDK